MQIALIRHGLPTVKLQGTVRMRDIPSLIDAYNSAGIANSPPPQVVTTLSQYDYVVCSHLKRSLESANALGYSDIHLSHPLFREVELPHFRSGAIPMPILYWVSLYRILAIAGFSHRGESLAMVRSRAQQAAEKLITLARQHQRVLFVGHGWINHFIAKALRSQAWEGPKKMDSAHWGYGVFKHAS